MLGLPPDWYKSRAYRSRVVREPRTVLREFGTEIDEGREARVHDSTAELRYFVVPIRPEGTEGTTQAEPLDPAVGAALPVRVVAGAGRSGQVSRS